MAKTTAKKTTERKAGTVKNGITSLRLKEYIDNRNERQKKYGDTFEDWQLGRISTDTALNYFKSKIAEYDNDKIGEQLSIGYFLPTIKKYIREIEKATAETQPGETIKQDGHNKSKEGVLKSLTAWQKHLIDKGLLYPDGKRVVKSLNETCAEYVDFTGNAITSDFTKENFKKKDDTNSDYTDRMCNKARDYANTPRK